MRGTVVSLVILALCGVIAACTSGAKAGKDPFKALSGEWTLDWLKGTGPVAAGARPPSLTIQPDGKVGGSTGVNRLSSSLDTAKLGKGEFGIGPAVTTRMAGPLEAMALETGFLDALEKATRYRIDGDHLVLSDPSGELLRFARGK